MHKLSTYALEKSDKLYVKTMLELAAKLYGTNWIFEETLSEDVLVDIDQPAGQTFWQQRANDPRVIPYGTKNTMNVPIFLHKPLRVQAIVEVLQRLPGSAQTPAPTPATPAPVATAHAVPTADIHHPAHPHSPVFIPDNYVVGLLLAARHSPPGQAHHLIIAGMEHLYISPQKNACYSAVARFTQITSSQKLLLCSPIKQLEQKNISEQEAQTAMEQKHLAQHPLESFLWYCALWSSQGRLMVGYSPSTPVKLKQFPNFTILPHEPLHMKLAAFMLKNTATLHTVAQETHIAIEKVTDFFNACVMIGVIQAEPMGAQENTKIRKTQPERQNLFKSILTRLIK